MPCPHESSTVGQTRGKTRAMSVMCRMCELASVSQQQAQNSRATLGRASAVAGTLGAALHTVPRFASRNNARTGRVELEDSMTTLSTAAGRGDETLLSEIYIRAQHPSRRPLSRYTNNLYNQQ